MPGEAASGLNFQGMPGCCSILSQPTGIIGEKYRLENVIGKGTFGVVRRAVHRKSGQVSAVKVVAKSKLASIDDVEDLRQEVEIMQALPRSDSIVELRDVYEDDEALYLVMELCKGGDLLDVLNSPAIAAADGFSESEAAEIFYQVAEAVAHCAENGVMHRDVKPENVLFVEPFAASRLGEQPQLGSCGHKLTLRASGRVARKFDSNIGNAEKERKASKIQEILDFLEEEGGLKLAKRKPARVKLGDWGLAVRVRPGELIDGMAGSDPYLCPEMILEELYGSEADVWSLGVLLYTLLSRRLPFSGKRDCEEKVGCNSIETDGKGDRSGIASSGTARKDLFEAICRGQLDLESEPWPSISREAKDLVSQMLAVDKQTRPKAQDILKHYWVKEARAILRPELLSTLIGQPGIVPLAEMRRLSCEGLTGLASLPPTQPWLSKATTMAVGAAATIRLPLNAVESISPGGSPQVSGKDSFRVDCLVESISQAGKSLSRENPRSITTHSQQSSAAADDAVAACSSLVCPSTCRSQSPSGLRDTSASRLGSALRLNDFSLNYRSPLRL